MRKLLLASVFALVPFMAFADNGFIAAGDVNLSKTAAGSTAGIASTQGTGAHAMVDGKGGVLVGAVSGNYTDVNTAAAAQAGPKGSATQTSASQLNIGGTIAGGISTEGRGRGNEANGTAGGGQNSQASGAASATASNTNLGGFVAAQMPKHERR